MRARFTALFLIAASPALANSFSFFDNGVGAPPLSPPFFAFSNESYSAGAGTFYSPFVFQENLNCPGVSCGQRNTLVSILYVDNGQLGQFYNVFETAVYARSGTGNFAASNPYVLICNARGAGPCADAAGVSGAGTEAVGEEVNTDVRIASVVRKTALQLVSTSTDIGTASAHNLDGALLIANQAGGVGFRNGVIFGQDASDFGVYGSLLYAPAGVAPTNYINFPHMVVNGSGETTIANVNLTAAKLPDNGFYLAAANNVGLAVNGTNLATYNVNGIVEQSAVGVDNVFQHVILNQSQGYADLELDAFNGTTIKGWVFSKRPDDTLQLYNCTGCVNSGYGPAQMTWKANGGFSASGFSVDGRGNIAAPLSTPASATAACAVGSIAWDTGFIYICTAADTWKRAPLATWQG